MPTVISRLRPKASESGASSSVRKIPLRLLAVESCPTSAVLIANSLATAGKRLGAGWLPALARKVMKHKTSMSRRSARRCPVALNGFPLSSRHPEILP